MSCNLTQGDTVPCTTAPGGIKSIRIIEWNNLRDGTVTAVSGVITVLTPANAAKFWKYELPNKNDDHFEDDPQKDNKLGTLWFKHMLQLTLRKMRVTLRNEVLIQAQARLAFIVEDHQGLFWLLGSGNGMDMETSTVGSGAGRNSFNGYVLKFEGEEENPAYNVPSNIVTTNTN